MLLTKQTIPADAKKRSAVVRRVRIDGAFPELQSRTSALTAGVKGRRLTLFEAYQLAASVQHAYAEAGYPLVNAIVRPQYFAKGEVRIDIIDGFIEGLDLSGMPQDLRQLVQDRLAPIVGQRHITLAEIQRHILLIGELPGVNGNTKSKPGVHPGGIILVVDATETPFTYGLGVNNYLPRQYGTFLFSQGFSINNTLGLGETIHAEAASTSDFGQFFEGQAKTQAFGFGGVLPIGSDGFTISGNYYQSRVSPITQPGTFAPGAPEGETFHGTLQRVSARANYPLLLSLQQTLRFQIGFDFTDDKGNIGPAPNFYTPAGEPIFSLFHDQYSDLRLAGEWSVNFPWALGGKAISALVYNHGVAGLTGNIYDPLSRIGASPYFNKLGAEVHVLQPLPGNFNLALLGRGQTGFGRPLMASEDLVLAGPDALSGFSLGSLYVDSGAVGRAELQRPFTVPLSGVTAVASPYLFGAWGGGRLEQISPGQNFDVHATSFGAGLRTNANFAGWPFNETVDLEAARVSSNVPYARSGYAGTFTYQMKYAGDPFASAPPRLSRSPDSRRPDFTSSGFYAGLNAGYAFDGSAEITSTGTVISNAADRFFFGNGAPVSAANITGSAPASPGTPIGGGQVGYNFAAGHWVLGAEADIQGAGAASLTTSSRVANATVAGATETATTVFEDSKSVDWLGTLRGRVGVEVAPNLLPYITGGLAVGAVRAESRATQSWADPANGPFSATASSSVAYGSYSNTLVGWTLGGGIEWMFAPGLSLKGEYLFYDLGEGHFSSGTLTTSALGFANVVASNSSARFDGHIIRIGLNYHFGMDQQPAQSRIVKGPAEDSSVPVWNGFYAGLNSGYAWGFNNNSGATNDASVGSNALDQQLSVPGFTTALAPASAAAISGKSNSVPSGFIGGGQVGYNLQLNRGLIGFEADLQGTGEKGHGSYASNNIYNTGNPAATVGLQTQVYNTASVDWLGTLRGRLGLFVRPDLLVYATGGLAYGETSSSTFINQHWSGPLILPLKTSGSTGISNKVLAGWTAGGGLEWMFSRNLSLKAEYLLYDLGHSNYGSSAALTTFGKSNSILPTTSIHYDGQIIRIGLNYYFAP